MASECSGIRSGCGCERRARQAQALFTARRGGCRSRCLDKVLRRARSPHRRGATPQRRSPGASASRRAGESGNLGSCRAFADCPGCQDCSVSVPRPGGDLGGRDRRAGERARAGAGGNWRAGNLERWDPRGAGRRRPAVARSAPRGAHSGGGHSLPHGPAARVPRSQRHARWVRVRAGARQGLYVANQGSQSRERVRSERSAGPARAGASHFPRVRVFARRSTSVPVTKSFLVFDR